LHTREVMNSSATSSRRKVARVISAFPVPGAGVRATYASLNLLSLVFCQPLPHSPSTQHHHHHQRYHHHHYQRCLKSDFHEDVRKNSDDAEAKYFVALLPDSQSCSLSMSIHGWMGGRRPS
jgi:hypothetical protein